MPAAKPQIAGPMWPGAGSEFSNKPVSYHHPSGIQPALPGNRRGVVWPGIARVDDPISTAQRSEQAAGPVFSGGQCAPGAGRADGGTVGPTGGRHSDGTPRFDQAVGPGAYLWWYVDAISDDGQHALSIIAFVGSVFSPYYARALAKYGAAVDPQNHCAINVALYSPGGRQWAMTERGRSSVERSSTCFSVGPSQLKWTGEHLQIDLDEVSVPFPRRIRGTVRVYPDAVVNFSASLDDQSKHRWGPIAPCARVEVDLPKPGMKWRGNAYLDSNEGDEPVTIPFITWDWSRARMADNSTAVIYDVTLINGSKTLLAERFKPDGTSEPFVPATQREKLPTTFWRVDRGIRSDSGYSTRVLETLEDSPFYARSLLHTQLFGEQVTAVHETLQPLLLNNRAVRMMLPWRMPRRA
jgi:carotenoid 1,2-hydratase